MAKDKRHKPRPARAMAAVTQLTRSRDELLLAAAIDFRDGRLEEAEARCVELLAGAPRFAPASHLMGLVAARTGRAADAIDRFGQAAALDQAWADPRKELTTLLRSEGRFAEAIREGRVAVNLAPRDAVAHNNLGLAYLSDRQLEHALASFDRASTLDPALAAAHLNGGIVSQLLSRDDDAIARLRRAIALDARLGDAHVKLGELLWMRGEAAGARASFARAVESATTVVALLQVARALADARQVDAARSCAIRAVAQDDHCADAHELLGSFEQQQGNFAAARACFERAVEIDPLRASAYLDLAATRRITIEDQPFVQRMLARLGDPALTDHDRARLGYALGKAYDDLGDYANAMPHFDEANRIEAGRLRVAGRMLDPARLAHDVDRLIETFTPALLERHGSGGSDDDLPVFVVGMIRSGTTLVEQIVSSHPEVGAGGELRYWGDRSAAVGDVAQGFRDPAKLPELARDYLSLLRGLAPGMRRVTDKMPTNFFLLGLIHKALPQARIIHCRRHPVDTCLSIYFTHYPRSPDYAHVRANIVAFYVQYARLMAHWRRTLPPDLILDVDYEDLIGARESVTRRIVEFCGLAWSDACLHHERNDRAIRTPSQWQARQPVYRSSIDRWRHYRGMLGEFAPLL